MAYKHSPREPIAIIGTGCRFPGSSTSPSKLWDLLISPRELSRTVPTERSFNADAYYHPNGERHGASNVTKSYFLEDDPRLFDAGFFSIAPREAEAIDPQQRLLLETVYEAMENAGLSLQAMKGSQTSVYCGAMSADYMDVQTRDLESTSQYMITGTSRALLANRLSYYFDWHGPSIAVDTACSSSLAAIHLGVQSLRNGEATTSCVAGSNLILGPDAYLAATSLHLLSPSGRSQMWDDGADGYARGEGICAFLMKTLSQALKDGDRIDGIIRETCVNSDGRTKGIALPSAEAQMALISTAYKNAGLDLLRAEDRPQYIEAHGTGTKAGDPLEARALSDTFFPPGVNHNERPTILVGSIKTIIGHTEGTAGIAGMLKVILAMRHQTVPPNQHLRNLNPDVAPYYKKLRIPTRPEAWPAAPARHPLRASVNGFGSGGTNCHAIIESYVPEIHDNGPWGRPQASNITPASPTSDADFTATPLVFSATSESGLIALLEKYSRYLEKNDVPIDRLALTLNSHRSTLPVRIAIAGISRQNVLQSIKEIISRVRSNPNSKIGFRATAIEFSEERRPRILGVFTGQGAQWPGMAQTLIKQCAMVSETIDEMEKALAQLPDPPAWSLREEIMKPPQTSRMSEAEFSLPICAAVQVVLVQLLRRAGIAFHTVVGHSGGEIGAAYAVGTINEIDAVKIAYYRGIVCKLAVGADGRRGSMIAVGFGYQEGLDFCATAQMKGRLTVAASNSPKSVTLAGDKDAVMEAKQILDKESMFNRVLQVDTGYHSHHMLPCAEPYTEQLKLCNVAVGSGNGFTAWVSSVYPDNRTIGPAENADMSGQYWTDNLIGRVLFSQALERALEDERGPPDMILEVGPHPALRGPSLETVRTKLGFEVPYSGVLDRKLDDVTALSNAIGSVWTNLGSAFVDFQGYASAFSQNVGMTPLPDLPTYAWDHKQILWRESRLNKQVRSRQDRPHELLGSRTPDDTEYEPRWRNFFKLEEMPWLRNHRIQNQIIVPAAAYCVMALEAAKVLGRGKHVQSIELLNVAIMRPIVLDEASEGTETLLSLHSNLDSKKEQSETIRAGFSLSSGAMEVGHLKTAATGEILIHLEDNDYEDDEIPLGNKNKKEAGLRPVNVDQFYASLDKIGLNYSGAFKTLISVERRMNVASAEVAVDQDVGTSAPVHPTWLDVCFQTFLAAFAAPRDDSLWTAFMPTAIGSMKFLNPNPGITPAIPASVNTRLDEMIPGYMAALPTLTGDMDIFNSHTGQLAVRIEDFTMSSFLPATEKDDKLLYLKTEWQQDVLSGIMFDPNNNPTSPDEMDLIDACEKTVQYYLQHLDADDASREKTQANPYLGSLVAKAKARQVSMPSDSEMSLIFGKFGEHIDMKLIKMIGEGLSPQPQLDQPPNTQPSASLSELIMQWHNEGLGFAKLEEHFSCALKQIAHKHERLRVLQIGPSSVSLVKAMCRELEHTLGPYTVVDGSTQTLNEMKDHLVNHPRVSFHAFDVEHKGAHSDDVIAAGSFDVVIVHKAFRNQAATLKTIRGLMRPGGFLVMMAATGQQLRFPFFLASSPPDADSLNQEDPDRVGHLVHSELQDAGFSGIDSIGLDSTPQKHTFSVVVSQALDERVRFMRTPLSAVTTLSMRGKLLVLGGASSRTEALLGKLQECLSGVWEGAINVVKSLADVGPTELNGVDAVLSVTELDKAMLKNLSEDVFTSLQRLLSASKTVLWVTQGARSKDPYQSGTIGLFRTFQSENLRKHVQLLDVDTLDGSGTLIANAFLRLMGGVAIATEDPESSPLWTVEEEVVVKDGKLYIPRIFLDQNRNRRLNALRRRVESPVAETPSSVTLYRPQRDSRDVYATEDVSIDQSKQGRADGQVTLKVKYCSLDPVIPNYNDKQIYCCFGHTESGLQMMALSTSQSSSVTVPYDWAVPYAHSGLQSDDALELLTRILSEIRSNIIVNSMPTGLTTLLDNADPHLAESLVKRSDLSGKDFAFLNAQKLSSVSAVNDKCIDIDLQASAKSLKTKIPQKAKLLIDMGNTHNTSTFHQNLPAKISIVDYCDLESPSTLAPSDLLSAAFRAAKSTNTSSKRPFDNTNVVTVSELVHNGTQSQPHALVVDWTKDHAKTSISIPIQTQSLFSKDKTYILVGLTGHIGQSVCRWMVGSGARNIVLTSRHPDLNLSWKDDLLAKGANVTIEAADVTKKQDVVELRERILSTMPAIGGIANGAMVMGNSFFGEMSFDTFQKVMAPKVDGSMNLDTVFSDDDLDFFILFSSISAVTGQQGQANYAAANNFMVGLASQRRARNLSASVIDIGMIIGLGFIQRTDIREGAGSTESALHNLDYMPVSERDLHQILAEAVLAGQSQDSPEIITGLHVYDTGHSPFWHTKALFSHLRSKAGFQKTVTSQEGVEKPLKERLRDAGDTNEALAIMEETFMKYLASSLKLDIESIYTDVPIIDLGIDSLVAVEIRNFMFTEAAHDVPVLKILGGSTIKQICTEIVSNLASDPSKLSPPAATEKTQENPVAKRKLPNGDSKDLTSTAPLRETNGVMSNAVRLAKSSGNGHVSSPAAPTLVRTAPLSLGQSRLWFLSQYLTDDTVLNCTISYELSGKINLNRLQKSIEAVIKRHETLRTVFFTNDQDGSPMQGTIQRSPFKLKMLTNDCAQTQAREEFDYIRGYRYDLGTGDTLVATILSHNADSHTLIFGYHHIIMDGVSWQIFQKDLAHYYDNSMARMTARPLSTQYIDFTEKQRLQLSEGSYAEHLHFFKEEFSDPVESLPLFPFARVSTRKALKQYKVRETAVNCSANLVSKLKEVARNSQTTSFHVFLSSFQVLLHRLLDVERICIGMVDANRSDHSFKDVVGFFLETIPILFHVDGTKTFDELLRSTRNKVYASLARTGVPTEEILRACNISSSTTETPLFQVCFNYRMGAGRTLPMKEVDVKFGSYADAQHPFDLVVSVDELDDGTARINLSLQDYLYDEEGAQLLADTYIHLLETLSGGTSAFIQDIPKFDAAWSKKAVMLGTGPNLDLTSSSDDTLSKIVETWSSNEPETVAVKDKHGESLTYAQTSKRATDISKVLFPSNDLLGTPIAVLLEPCVDTIATLLGILRADASYVPLDVRSPDETLTTILEESGSQILLYHEATQDRVRKLMETTSGHLQPKLVALEAVPHEDSEQTEDASTPDGIAMILFTSGSTGKPKGIPLSNANIRATILGASNSASLGKEIVLQQSGQGFDAAVYQIFTALANGGTVVMGDNRDHPSETAALMEREGVTCTTFIVSEMQAMLNYAHQELRLCSSWRTSMVAGELFTKSLLNQFHALGKQDLEIINAYGPTEASICTSMHRITSSLSDTHDSSVPIGKAIPNHSMYVVDEACKPVPVGWPGEIVVSGPGVARGYLNPSKGSATKFIQQSKADDATSFDCIYRTGDRGRMLSDGSIMMLSRLDGDEQVKIRGMRVNLKDVSQAIIQESRGTISDATVILRGDDASKRHLIAFAVLSRTSHIQDKQAFLRQLSLGLSVPTYMRPVAIIPLESFPMTVRGKLDIQKLASLPWKATHLDDASDEELSEHEARLRDIWRDVLGEIASHETIDRTSEFFAIGGNSLLLLPLKAEIRQHFGVDLPLPQLFQASTLELQAALIAGVSKVDEIDWEKEIELDENFFESWSHTNVHESQDHQKGGVSVLLTGSTGYLGTAILQRLVEDPQIDSVYCVAIRDDDKGEPRQLHVQSPKIVRYAGDLTMPNLSLTQAQFEDLSDKVDVIIHNGAEVSHMKNYRSLRAANVSSTIELARMAGRKRVPFHYISTGGVARLSGASSQPEASLAAYKPTGDGSDGYVASKWTSEVILENINRRYHVPVWIHRPSSITGDNVPTLDIIHSLLEYSRLMKAVPDLTGSVGALDFVHLDSVATAVANCTVSSTQKEQNESGVSYVHHCGEKIVPLDQFKDHLEGSATGSFNTLAIQDWVAGALDIGLDEIVGSLMLASKGVIKAPLLEKRG
ncbi:hypothetical protein EKO04_005132 [Ascochyta lentis]|uniref:Polyketide synthase n=1 Tax=Ascochyta lentis TaxID=205686 RepID=A0A8H7J5U2_9PLEO|nr:hypothetical protein EKO04_005132 [Ascochyta lentis]